MNEWVCVQLGSKKIKKTSRLAFSVGFFSLQPFNYDNKHSTTYQRPPHHPFMQYSYAQQRLPSSTKSYEIEHFPCSSRHPWLFFNCKTQCSPYEWLGLCGWSNWFDHKNRTNCHHVYVYALVYRKRFRYIFKINWAIVPYPTADVYLLFSF